MIYFIRSEMRGGEIKIGTSQNVGVRINTQRERYPDIEILGIHEGGREVEQALHERFSAYRRPGRNNEWFEPSDEIYQYINENARPYVYRLPRKTINVGVYSETKRVLECLMRDQPEGTTYADVLEAIVNDAYPNVVQFLKELDTKIDAALDADTQRLNEQ